jgi:cellulose synthase/poly-beta-1,6-N-acetylglucosamine synthase-like glycosyltransferase/spore germination protein YaaH/peptidoglycan/xylan/chitin deacetylase (PgdA/CDA1 family)
MSEHAVFFDPSRKRWSWVKRISTVLGLLSVVVVSAFLVSVVSTPLLPEMPGITSEIKRSLRRSTHFPRHDTRLRQFILRRSREKLLAAIAQEQAQKARQARAIRPAAQSEGIVAAFYAPWQETGLHSLRANASRMTHLLPAWVHLQPNARGLDFHDWDNELTPHNKDVLDVARTNKLSVLPVLSNAQQSDFDPQRVHVFLSDIPLQTRIILQLRNWLLSNHFQGVNVDFENLRPEDYPLYVTFLHRLRGAFQPSGLLVSADLQAGAPLDWKAVSAICDFVVIMAYDEHASGTGPGPIASMNWYRSVLQRATRSVPRDKLVIGLANYAYDWTEGRNWPEPLTYQGALVAASTYRQNETPDTIVDFDPEALNPTFWYVDDEAKEHEVWMLDAVTAANQWMIAQNYGLRGVAVWVLGSTDPSIWTFISREHLSQPPNPGVLREVNFPYDIEFVGEGEILHISALPTTGSRTLEIDPRTKLFLDESYRKFPTSFVIGRTGYKEKEISLTIDDGPASPYTAQMLDELKKANVKATFFLIGQNAERYPSLVHRIWDEGHAIGNHTYTHPNTGAIPEQRARFELNATQRVFQSILQRSTLLFRPPYNADAEPDSAEEVRPVVLASSLNYITVGEFIDPQDWRLDEPLADGTRRHRTAEDMLQTVVRQLDTEQGSCVLLHDGGGDRTETVRLIPMLIRELRARGYQFVNVSDLINSTRDAVNPKVTNSDTLMMASDRIVFEAIYLFELFLGSAFISGIILGALRVAFVSILALIGRRREKRERFDDAFRPSVSVVIAAFNEEKVIVRTIDSVLANGYPGLEIILVDDGSKDDTAGEVRRRFGDRPEVRVITQENSGKAAALNNGMAEAKGEIIIALDADTIFRRDTIALLVRRFADPLVGAVAGNVKVGNRINPLTYWQAIEYITSQNLDRRAYAVINSVTVVPGAVGAWRREAIGQAGGYTTDTMAEDMDLTWRIRRIGWRIETESAAVGYTEAPDSFRALFKQRFRWAFGTLQCLWKHRRALGRYQWFGKVMLPSLWLFQVAYQAISPLVDLQILWSLGMVVNAWARGRLTQDWQPLPNAFGSLYVIGFMYSFFFVIELIGAAIAFKLDREDGKMLVWLFWQRFLYRQLMYAVLLRSIKTAVSGMRAGWGKLERKGTVQLTAGGHYSVEQP